MKRIAIFLVFVAVLGAGGAFFYASRPAVPELDLALIEAARSGDVAKVKAALGKGANPNASVKSRLWEEWFGEKNWEEGYSALMYAAQVGSVESVGVLLDAGAKIDAQSHDGITAVMLAAHHLQTKTVEFLLEKGADVRLKATTGSNLLDCAKKRNVTPESRKLEQLVARAMLKAGMDVQVPSDLPPGAPGGP